jgi:hypothetical protein
MRSTKWMVAALGVAFLFGTAVRAADKEVTLKGTILCAKCALKETKKCVTCIKVQEDGKDVVYYFLDRGNKEEYHEEVCGGGQKAGTVTGVVSEKDGKKYITPKKVEYTKGAAAAPRAGCNCCATAAKEAPPAARGCCARRRGCCCCD